MRNPTAISILAIFVAFALRFVFFEVSGYPSYNFMREPFDLVKFAINIGILAAIYFPVYWLLGRLLLRPAKVRGSDDVT